MEINSEIPRITADISKGADEQVEEFQAVVADQKNMLEPLLNTIDSSCMDTEHNQVSHYIPACCTI
jgi:hypothetical protein